MKAALKIKKGDKVRFNVLTRQGRQKGERIVQDIVKNGAILEVHFRGWSNFRLHKNEVTHINGVAI